MKDTQTRRRYTVEFKLQAVELVRNGRPVPEVAKDLELEKSILYRWVTQAETEQRGGKNSEAGGEEGEAAELLRLRRENATLRLENDILKKAAVILGRETSSRDGQ